MRPLEEWSSASPSASIAGRLMAAMADEYLVERKQRLTRFELGLDHGARFHLEIAGVAGGKQFCQPADADAHQDAVIEIRRRIDAEDRLAVEIFGDVGDQPVLPDGDNDVVGRTGSG